MVLRESDMQELRNIQIEMLKCFVNVCDRLDLKYYILYGTLLGAVRHRGFIPWDDDIDVGMLRRDYECFIKNAQKLLPDYYFVQYLDSEKEYTMNMAKIRDSRTTFIESSVKTFDMNHGVYIDIFPLDYYPEAWVNKRIFEFKKRLFSQAVRSEYSSQGTTGVVKRVLTNGVHSLFGSGKKAARKLNSLYQNQQKSNYLINNSSPWGNEKEIMPCEWYGSGITVNFEGLSVKAPQCTNEWLRHVYGNYMRLPPEEERITHHFTEIIDLHHSYKEYKR